MKKIALAFSAVAFASMALAADPVGDLREVSGNVSVGDGKTVMKGVAGTPVVQNGVVLVPSNAYAIIRMKNGCDIRVNGGEQLVVDSGKSCAALLASVTKVAQGSAVAGANVSTGMPTATAVAGVGYGALAPVAMAFVFKKTAMDDQANSPK